MASPKFEISPPQSAQENMDEDGARLGGLQEGDPPHLRLYSWRAPSLTYGYFIKPHEWLHLEELAAAGYELGRRPTGGGILFHTHDIAFSVLIPKGHPRLSENTLENYWLINSFVQKAVAPFLSCDPCLNACCETRSSFCMAHPTIYDVMLQGKKIGGAAQRRARTGLLHQGTLSLKLPDLCSLTHFLKDPAILKHMEQHAGELNCSQQALSESLIKNFLMEFSRTPQGVLE